MLTPRSVSASAITLTLVHMVFRRDLAELRSLDVTVAYRSLSARTLSQPWTKLPVRPSKSARMHTLCGIMPWASRMVSEAGRECIHLVSTFLTPVFVLTRASPHTGRPDDPTPSALFARHLMHYCCEEVDAALTRPGFPDLRSVDHPPGVHFQICIAYSHAGLPSVRGTQEIVRHYTTS